MTKFVCIMLLLLSSPLLALDAEREECGYRTIHEGEVFRFIVARTLSHYAVDFLLCEKQDSMNYLLAVVTDVREQEQVFQRRVILDPDNYSNIYQQYESALEYNTLDDRMGADGSIWCLQTKRGFARFSACLWGPQYDSEERGIQEFARFGELLWSLAEIPETYGELY